MGEGGRMDWSEPIIWHYLRIRRELIEVFLLAFLINKG